MAGYDSRERKKHLFSAITLLRECRPRYGYQCAVLAWTVISAKKSSSGCVSWSREPSSTKGWNSTVNGCDFMLCSHSRLMRFSIASCVQCLQDMVAKEHGVHPSHWWATCLIGVLGVLICRLLELIWSQESSMVECVAWGGLLVRSRSGTRNRLRSSCHLIAQRLWHVYDFEV